MKPLFFILLFINVFYALWRTQVEPTQPPLNTTPVTIPIYADVVQPIILLHEHNRQLDCHAIGPFRFRVAAEHALERAKSRDIEATLRIEEKQEILGYRVFLPPFASRDAAREVATYLSQQGIEDMYVIHEGEQRHAIALGVFSRQSRAKLRVEQIQSLGHTPQIETRALTLTMFWIDFIATVEKANALLAELPTELQVTRCQ